MAEEADYYGQIVQRRQRSAAAALMNTEISPDDAAKTLSNATFQGVPYAVGALDLQTFNTDADQQKNIEHSLNSSAVQAYLSNHDFAASVSKDDLEQLGVIDKMIKALKSGYEAAGLTAEIGEKGMLFQAARALGQDIPVPPEIQTLARKRAELPQFEGGLSVAQALGGFVGSVISNKNYIAGGVGLGAAAGASTGPAGIVAAPIGAVGGGIIGFAAKAGVDASVSTYLKLDQEVTDSGKRISEPAKQIAAMTIGLVNFYGMKFGAEASGVSFASDVVTNAVKNPTIANAVSRWGLATAEAGATVGAINMGLEAFDTLASDLARLSASSEFKTVLDDPLKRQEALDRLTHSFVTGAAFGGIVHGTLSFPGAGANYFRDQQLVREARVDAKNLDDLQTAAEASKTLERSPEAFKAFAAEAGEHEIGIPADAIQEAFGDKAGEAFKWVKDFDARFAEADATGGDLRVPLTDWLAAIKEDPALAQKLKDDRRARPEGLTTREADELEKAEPESYERASAAPLWYQGIPEEGVGKPQQSEYWTTNLDLARDYAGKGGFVHVARHSDLPPFMANKAEGGKTDSIWQGERRQVPTIATLARDTPNEQFTALVTTVGHEAQAAAKRELWLQPLFPDAKSAGMTEPQFAAYSKRLQAEDTAEYNRALASATREAERHLTPEWKANEARIRKEVESDLSRRPVFVADEGLRANKLDEDSVRTAYGDDAVSSLPVYVVGRRGIAPDDAATLFGFRSGTELVAALASLNKMRGEARPAEYRRLLVDEETAARMEEKYGDLGKNILAEARESVGTGGQANLLAEEMFALARQLGELPENFSKEIVERQLKVAFGDSPALSSAKSDRFVRDIGKAGRQAEMALLKGDLAEAFRAKQRQYVAFLSWREATKFQKEFEKGQKQLDRVLKNESVESIDQVHFDHAKAMLESIGFENRGPVTDRGSLAQFVANSEGQIAVAHFFLDPGAKEFKSLKDMTVADFRAVDASITSMLHIGREINKLNGVRGKADLQNVIFNIKAELDRFDLIHQPLTPTVRSRAGALGRWVNGWNLLPERMFDYIDKFNPFGPITSFLDRPLRDANSKEIRLTEQVVSQLKPLRKLTDNSVMDLIDNKVLPDGLDRSGFLSMTRHNLRVLIGYMGSESGATKVIEGFGLYTKSGEKVAAHVEAFRRQQALDKVWDLIHRNAKEEDFKWAEGHWKIFEGLYKEANELSLRDSGVPLDPVEGRTFDTKFGKYEGGYWPISYDRARSNIEGHLAAKQPLFDQHYVRATTPQGYTVSRTQFKAPLDLSGSMMANKIKAMVHDVSYREAIRNAGKLIYNEEFMSEITKKWSKQYADLLPGWLKDVANSHRVDDSYAIGAAAWSAAVRQNVVSALIFLNPGTIFKHGFTAAALSAERVGLGGITRAVKDIVSSPVKGVPQEFTDALKLVTDSSEQGESVRQFILDSSAVMRNRQRQYQDTIRGAYKGASTVGLERFGADLRQTSMYIGRFPVSMSDAISAMPTWYAAYKKAFEKTGGDHTDSVFIADKEVSRAHGSSAILDKSRVLRTGEAMRWMTPLFNFWNHAQNNLMQIYWDVAATAKGREEPGANIKSLSNRMFWLALMPIVVEEMASPALDEDRRSLGTKAFLATMRFFGAGYIGLRDITNAVANGYEPSVGLMGTLYKGMTDAARDAWKEGMGEHVSKNWPAHAATALGFATGLGGAQVGKTGGFVKDLLQGKEFPTGLDEYRQGFRTGHSKPRIHK